MRHGGLRSNPSASGAETFLRCPASHVFPQASEDNRNNAKGTAGHEDLNERFMLGKAAQISDILDGKTELKTESAYVVNVKAKTSRFLGCNKGRNYGPLADYEVPCTLDVEGRLDTDTRWLRDWKFGTYASRVQLEVQAMAVLYLPGETASVVDAGFVYLGDGHPIPEESLIGRMDVDERADDLVKAFDSVASVHAMVKENHVPDLHQGSWCKYCPARHVCPAKWRMVRAAIGDLAPVSELVGSMTVDKCGEAWTKLREIQRYAEQIEAALKGRLEEGEVFPLPNGKELYAKKRRGWSYPQKDKTVALLKQLGATQSQMNGIMNVRADSFSMVERVKK